MFSSLTPIVLRFSIAVLLVTLLSRFSILWMFGNMQEYASNEVWHFLFLSIRFDLKLIATLLLVFVYIPAIFYLGTGKRVILQIEKYFLWLLFNIVLIFSFIDYGYYLFFGNAIDPLFFGIINDGTIAVIQSLFGDSRLVLIFFATVLTLLIVNVWIYKKMQNVSHEITVSTQLKKDYLKLFVIILGLFVLARGSVGTFPLTKKSVSTIENTFLSDLTMNALWHFYYAYKDSKRYNFKVTSTKILMQAGVKNEKELLRKSGYSVEHPLLSHTEKNDFLENNKPHVIFVLQEGWSTQIAEGDDEDNNLLGAFAKHAQEDHFYKSFFSNAYGTNPTIEALLLNSFIPDLSQSYGMKTSFALSSILPFKKKGYETLFLSGGTSTWRNHKNFWMLQGFDNYIGRATIESYYNVKCDNPWGVYEEYLFKYLKKTITKAVESDKPSFTFVLTTNNHPPVKIPEAYRNQKFDLEKLGFDENDELHANMLKGYHYQLNAFGEFLTWLKSSKFKDNVIVVSTGDHILKGYDNYFPIEMQYLKYAVPVYFYLPERYDKLKTISNSMVGSHNDIFPTLFHLALSHVAYYHLGTPLMQKEKMSAIGWHKQKRFVVDEGVIFNQKLYPWEKSKKRYLLKDIAQPLDKTRQQQVQHIHYQRILRKYLLTKAYEKSKDE